jgi:catechol 2,3-dioxygenase
MTENVTDQPLESLTIDSTTTVGTVTLAVSDLDRLVQFYQQVIGLTVLNHNLRTAELGLGEAPLVRLEARPNGQRYPQATGLYHLALLLPTRQDLAHWLKHFVASQHRMIDGAADHLVSEALYLSDPEGNGLEIYRDRARDTWEYDGDRIKMAILPLDLPALVAAAPETEWTGLPPGTTMGHVHLQVNDVAKAVWFYRDVLGFSYNTGIPGAGFLGAGGYHHHIGVNTWHSEGAAPPPPGSLGLLNYTIVLPTEKVRDTLLTRLDALNYPIEHREATPLVRDPAGNSVLLAVE